MASCQVTTTLDVAGGTAYGAGGRHSHGISELEYAYIGLIVSRLYYRFLER